MHFDGSYPGNYWWLEPNKLAGTNNLLDICWKPPEQQKYILSHRAFFFFEVMSGGWLGI
jgi:hypothetical protein